MSQSASQAAEFYRQVAELKKVFTVEQDGGLLVFPMADGDVVPFWSSEQRLERVREHHPKYRRYDVQAMSLEEFIAQLDELAAEGISVGVNWSGKRLTGYDVSVDDLRQNLAHLINRSATPL